jgi:hypothetical protein
MLRAFPGCAEKTDKTLNRVERISPLKDGEAEWQNFAREELYFRVSASQITSASVDANLS